MLRFSNSEVTFELSLCYTPLPSFSLHTLNGFPPISKDTGEPPPVVWVWLSCDLLCVQWRVCCVSMCIVRKI